MSNFITERRVWEAEVDAEAARLLRLGVPPWDALIQARQRVQKRRLWSTSAKCSCRDNFANPEPIDCPVHRAARFPEGQP